MPEAARTKLRKLLDVKLSGTRNKNGNWKVAKPKTHNRTGQLSEEQKARSGDRTAEAGVPRGQKAEHGT